MTTTTDRPMGIEVTQALLPCPFCEDVARLFSISFPLGADCADIQVSCTGCDAVGPSVMFVQDCHTESDLPVLEAEAITAWNTRQSSIASLTEAPDAVREAKVRAILEQGRDGAPAYRQARIIAALAALSPQSDEGEERHG